MRKSILTQQNQSRRGVRHFLESTSEVDGASVSENDSGNPIAQRFEHCTVFFGDIAGFTLWSSSREPTEVFSLLEALYQAFDE